MALIKCKDCNNDISDSAASCPKCGAPVPITIGSGQEQCPHCMTVVDENATKCPSCRAVKGYLITPKPQPSLVDDLALAVCGLPHNLAEESYLPS